MRISQGRSVQVSWRWWLALVPLVVLAHEAHELAHTITGRLVCGAWAQRDFGSWSIAGCSSLWPTAAGPMLSYLLMSIGVVAAMRAGRHRAWALALIAAANPLARIITVASGHGDEWLVVHELADAAPGATGWYLFAVAIALLPAGAAMLVAWRATAGLRARAATYVVLMVSAMAVTGPGVMLGNRLLRAGVWDQPIAGAPWLVHAVTGAALLAALFTVRSLRTFADDRPRPSPGAVLPLR
jgi:hypothetical protein